MTKRTTRLREIIKSPGLEFLMESHNGLSARIVEEAGFSGIWAGGLALSAQFGVRDSNEASWSQVVDMLEFMADTTTIPILFDGDTGYGNFNTMRRLVRKLEQRGIAGVCIEDKLFPKTNSFIAGERQPLCDIEEFCGKIKAGKDHQQEKDFCIVARVEALIAGWGLEEALHRAHMYAESGADAILIHSKKTKPDEILAFANEWKNELPLVIVPTKYYSTPTDIFRQAEISLVIWANHLLRAAIAKMQETAKEIKRTETLVHIEDRISPLREVFRLQQADELAQAEQVYLVSKQQYTNAIILAADRGKNMDVLTEMYPKTMIPIAGKPLLRRLVDAFKHQQIHDISVVTGYKSESVFSGEDNGVNILYNPRYAESGELISLLCAREKIGEDTVIVYGDLLFRSYILRDLLEANGEIVLIVDSMLPTENQIEWRDLVYCSSSDSHSLFPQDILLENIVSRVSPKEIRVPSGRWIGMMKVQGKGKKWLMEALNALALEDTWDTMSMIDILQYIRERGNPIRVLYIRGHWLDVNSPQDITAATSFAGSFSQ